MQFPWRTLCKTEEGIIGNIYVIFLKNPGRVGMEECSLHLIFLIRIIICFSGGGGLLFETAKARFLDKVRTFIFVTIKKSFHNCY